MSTGWIITCSAVAWTATCLLLAEALFGRSTRIHRRIEAVSRRGDAGAAAQALFRNWRSLSGESSGINERLRRFVEQSGVAVSLHSLLALAVALAGACGAAGAVLAPHPAWGLATLAGGLMLPLAFIWQQRLQRIERMRRQLPEAFDAMSRAVQAGQTVQSALLIVAADCRPPLSAEFRRCCDQQNLGLSQEATLHELAERVPIVELRMFIIVLLVQRQCGGSPVEVLNNMSDLVRKRMRLAQRVRALTGEGRMQAFVLTILPIAAFAWLSLTRPEYIQTLLDRPQLLIAIAAMQACGTIWIHRIVRINY
jgi:tight adherence protein B